MGRLFPRGRRLDSVTRLVELAVLCSLPVYCAPAHSCAGGTTLGDFRITVIPASGGPALPLHQVNTIDAGRIIRYDPVRLPEPEKDKGEVALVLVPAGESSARDLMVLDPFPADRLAEWHVPKKVSVVALVFGPHGLSMKKVRSLVDKNEEILTQLADYAQQTSNVEGLVQALSQSERSGSSLSAALTGFSRQYGVALPKLDTKAATDQQAAALLQALVPAASSYDPLAGSKAAMMQQSAGLAASVAALFFGSPVGLAAGGASLFQNMRTLLFPDTDFRSTYAQPHPAGGMALCAKKQPARSRTRLAYLWAHRLPDLPEPKVSLAGLADVPLGSKSIIRVNGTGAKNLSRAIDWRLEGSGGDLPVPVSAVPSGDAIEIDLTKSKAAPGTYRLAARWDWSDLKVPGEVNARPYGDLKNASLTRASMDRLVEGSGVVKVELTGANFEFLEKAAVERAGKRLDNPAPVEFTLPLGKRGGEQKSLEVAIDTSRLGRGNYRLLLTQSDNLTHEIPFTILPPSPVFSGLPVRVNVGEKEQKICLRGSGLERIEHLAADAAQIELEPPHGEERPAVVRLNPQAKPGDLLALRVKVQGIEQPLAVPGVLRVAGPLPKIEAARKSFASDGIMLHPEELPAGYPVSFALSVEHLETPVFTVRVFCDSGEPGRTLTLNPGQPVAGAQASMAGSGMIFLSFDPGSVGQSGCRLASTVEAPDTGRSAPFALGRVIRIPHIDQFTLTDERIGENLYAGILTGQDLDTIDKTGWDATNGVPVQAIPTPVAGDARRQTLKIALSWPAPAPHAQVFVWLRGESSGRPTGVKY